MSPGFVSRSSCRFFYFFFNDSATTEIYTLSLHDALPISDLHLRRRPGVGGVQPRLEHRLRTALRLDADLRLQLLPQPHARRDRKSTRLNSSHANISYAVFCLKKNKRCRMATRVAAHRFHT